MATASFVLVAAFSMVFFAGLLQLIAIQYAQGVLRAALDEGVRRAAPALADELACQEGIADVLADLMSGPLGEGIAAGCSVTDSQVIAAGEGVFPVWFPGVPDVVFSAEVRAVKEVDG